MDIQKTYKALESLEKSSKLLREAGFANAADTLERMYDSINSDLCDGLADANDIRDEQELDDEGE